MSNTTSPNQPNPTQSPIVHLQALDNWAKQRMVDKKKGCAPWEWFQLMKLREVIDDIQSMLPSSSEASENLPGLGQHSDESLQLVVNNDQPDKPPRHPDLIPVRMPMLF